MFLRSKIEVFDREITKLEGLKIYFQTSFLS